MNKILRCLLKKQKIGAISIVLFSVLSALLLNVSITLQTNTKNFFQNKTVELDAPDISYLIVGNDSEEIVKKVAAYDAVVDWQEMQVAVQFSVNAIKGEESYNNNMYFQSIRQQKDFAKIEFIDEVQTSAANYIYLPLYWNTSYGYKSGETVTLEIQNMQQDFVIHGFFEDVYHGSPSMGSLAIVSEEYYQQIAQNGLVGKILQVKTRNLEDAKEMLHHIADTIREVTVLYSLGMGLELAEEGATTYIQMIGMVFLGIAAMLLCINLIVVVFCVLSGIEDNITEIGIWKAGGYTTRQIQRITLIQYGMLAMIGSILGIVISIYALPQLSEILASSVGLVWKLPTQLGISILSIFVVVGFTCSCVLFTVLKIHHITPLVAMRFGVKTHNFKGNSFPLQRLRGNLNIGLMLKMLCTNYKQNIFVLIIAATLSFAGVFSLQLYGNMVVEQTAIKYLFGFPLTDAWIMLDENEDNEILEELAQLEGVLSHELYRQQIISVGNRDAVGLYVAKDFSRLNKKTIVKGRYPKNANEIVISSSIAKEQKKRLGDEMEFTLFGNHANYIIVGITEQLEQLNYVVDMTEEGMRLLKEDYELSGMIYNLKDDISYTQFLKSAESILEGVRYSSIDGKKLLETQLLSFEAAIQIVVSMMIGILFLVTTLILVMLLSLKITRERTMFGILKAIGFTSFQLMIPLVGSFTLSILIGSIIGGILGTIFTNDVVNLLFANLNIGNVEFSPFPQYALLFIGFMLFTSVAVSLFVAQKVKQITTRCLLVE